MWLPGADGVVPPPPEKKTTTTPKEKTKTKQTNKQTKQTKGPCLDGSYSTLEIICKRSHSYLLFSNLLVVCVTG